jgi:hypothetical protein
MLNRRRFLVLSAGAGAAALHALSATAPGLDTALALTDDTPLSEIHFLAGISALKFSAVTTRNPELSQAINQRMRLRGYPAPVEYANESEMLRLHSPDLLVASSPALAASQPGVHVLLTRPIDPAGCDTSGDAGRCLQILPRHEFVGSWRARAAAGLTSMEKIWTKASIRLRTGLPSPRVETPEALEQWLWREAGESIDFAMEALALSGVNEVESRAIAGPVPGSARFTFRIASDVGPETRAAEVVIDARPDLPSGGSAPEIVLARPGMTTNFRGALRSESMTSVLIYNLVGSIATASPHALAYSAASLLPARRSIAMMAANLRPDASRHIS